MPKLNQGLLDQIVTRAATHKNIHGAIIHIESADKIISLTSAAGNMSVNSQYYIASINKLLISFITHSLCQDGKMKLSDKISTYLSQEVMNGLLVYKDKDYSNELTIAHLISHTSGLPDYLIDKRPDGKRNMDFMLHGDNQSWPLDKVISEVKKMKPKFAPGSIGKANYSEVNFRLLGKILERVTQKSIRELLTATFEKLKMNDTFVLPSESASKSVPIYFKQNMIKIDAYWKSTNHDVVSTAHDQMKFIRAFFEGEYLTKETITNMQRWNSIFFPFKYGLGIQKFHIPRIFSPFSAVPDMLGHSGSVGSVAFFIPDKKLYVAGTVNQPSNVNVVFQTILKAINEV